MGIPHLACLCSSIYENSVSQGQLGLRGCNSMAVCPIGIRSCTVGRDFRGVKQQRVLSLPQGGQLTGCSEGNRRGCGGHGNCRAVRRCGRSLGRSINVRCGGTSTAGVCRGIARVLCCDGYAVVAGQKGAEFSMMVAKDRCCFVTNVWQCWICDSRDGSCDRG